MQLDILKDEEIKMNRLMLIVNMPCRLQRQCL